MSILSTNKKLIKVGAEYSAGSGISIDNYVISVTGDVGGKTYSAGENIGIYTQDNQLYISGKDWEQDIANASANAFNAATAQIPEPQDWTDTIKGASSYSYEQSTSYFDNWVEGQYTGDITNITNKITALSGDLSGYYKKTETSSKDEINDALQYVSANAGKVYEGVSPIVVNNTEDKISADTWTFSAGSNVSFVDDNVNKITRIDVTAQGGDAEVNSFVYDNSAKINDVNSSYQSNSGTFLTAAPANMATTGDIADLAQSVSETYQTKGDYAERAFVLSSIESATSGKLDVSSFASVSSDFLTNEDLNGYATESFVENVSGDITALIPDTSNFITNTSAETTYQTIGGMVDYAKASALDNLTNDYSSNSGVWNEVSTTYQNASADYLTAHQSLDGYATQDWVTGQGYLTGINIPESAQWNEISAYELASANYLTAHQSLENYATTAQVNTVSSNLSAAIDALDESITTGVVEDLYNYNIKGLNLYGVTSTSSYPSSGYVSTFSSESTTHYSTEHTVFGLYPSNMSQWNGKPYVSISSNGDTITGDYQCKVFYLFDSITDNSWNNKNPFSGEVGILDKNNFVVYNNYVKPSYFTNNGVSNFNVKIVFSANDGGYHPFNAVLAFGDLGVTGTNTISGIFVPSASDLSNYYKKTETSSKQQISTTVTNLFNYFKDSNQYVQSKSGMIDSVVTSYITSAGTFLNCYETVNTNSGSWGGGNPEVENYVQSNSGNIDETVTSFQTNSSTYMAEPNLEYNAVGEISGYGSSAIAQYGAEKQWLVHDSTLCHLSNSAQYALGCNISALQRLMGVDETVLFSGEASTSMTLSESPLNFTKIRVYTRVGATVGGNQNFGCGSYSEFLPYNDFNYALITGMFAGTSGNEANIYNVATKWAGVSGKNWIRTFYGFRAYTATGGFSTAGNWSSPYVVIGIGRKN